MQTNPLLPNAEKTSLKRTLLPPLVVLALLAATFFLGTKWIQSRASARNPIFHQTESGWQQIPAPAGYPEKLRISSSGMVWVLTWGRNGLSSWDGSQWRYYKDTD